MTGFLEPGDLFLEKYRIERLIGKGGMGAVYAAVDVDLARRVAIKLLLPHIASIPQAVTRFVNEGRAAARIEGEHVARVYAAGRTPDGLAYMVLELLEGADLAELLRRHPRMPVVHAVDFVLEALEAVAEAHHQGIVHRDLKPGNLFLARRSHGTETVKVLDFGISKVSNSLIEPSADHALTSTRSTLGSPLYMSPEQLRSAKNVDRRSDIWSVGVILYEMLAGVLPYHGEALGELFAAILEQNPIPIVQHRPDIPPALAAVVHRCLERDPQRRIADTLELALGLAPFGSRAAGSVERIRAFAGLPAITSGMLGAGTFPTQAPQGPFANTPAPHHFSSTPAPNPFANTPAPKPFVNTPAPANTPAPTPERSAQTTQGWGDVRTGSSTGPALPVQKRTWLPFLLIIPVAFVVGGSIFAIFFFTGNRRDTPTAIAPSDVAPTKTAPAPAATVLPAPGASQTAGEPSSGAPAAEPASSATSANVAEKDSVPAADAGAKPSRSTRKHGPAAASSTPAPSASQASPSKPAFDPTKDTRN
ncbi:protein kinase domain-containing protein [Pendulispora albinea]|uniref:Protein kinase n=1 Tax=Pendulispora albinea TaxID=2741071 RepID=A0ABZ2LX77_9BACT